LIVRDIFTLLPAALALTIPGALIANVGGGLKCVILDAEAVSHFDSTAANALENLGADLE
jgi:hypothetical protein